MVFPTNDLTDYFGCKYVCKQSNHSIQQLLEDIENYKRKVR